MLKKLATLAATTTMMFGMGVMGSAAPAAAEDDPLAVLTVPSGCTTTFLRAETSVILTNGPSITIDPPFIVIELPDGAAIVDGTTANTIALISCIV